MAARSVLKIGAMLRAQSHFSTLPRISRLSRVRGIALIETLATCLVITVTFLGVMQSLLLLNQRAVLSRLQTNARAIVQRNIDRALSEKYTPNILPTILATTAANGAVWDDDGGTDGLVTVVAENGTTNSTVRGTLTRTVTTSSVTGLRLVRFSLTYAYRTKNYTFAASTARARD